jgi:hypothetical protein
VLRAKTPVRRRKTIMAVALLPERVGWSQVFVDENNYRRKKCDN